MTPRTTRLVATFAAVTAVTAVTACTTTADGTPYPEPSTSTPQLTSSPPTTSTKPKAPRVARPLDASAFVAAPCTTLTPAQLSSLKVAPPGTIRGGDGFTPGCTWRGDRGSIGIGWLTDNKGGLSDTYRGRVLEAYFIETTVADYPAVFVDATDNRDRGYCGIVVGVSDTLTYYASVHSNLDAVGACGLAEQVAIAALTTVKEAN